MKNYVNYHIHSELSLLDSCTNFKLYVDKAVQLGQHAIGITEHGNISQHISKKMYCNEKGIKFLHGIEIYLTRELFPKVRDNYHTILIAKNYKGYLELNALIELSSREDHSYYNDRITFDEFFNLSENIIKISACLASPLNRLDESDPIYEKLVRHYDYLEVQPHINSAEQKEYNKKLLRLSESFGIPLIAGTDTHSLDDYKAQCREILLKAKGRAYGDEETYDLTYKTYDELVEMFRLQGVLPPEAYLMAIDNTNKMADSVEDWDIDKSFKYPKLYENEDEIFKKRVFDMYERKLSDGVIKPNPQYMDNITEEMAVFSKIGMTGFMLFMSELMCWCWDNGIPSSPCRGSVGGSTIAYITDITDVDPVTRGTVFSRFANEHRIEIGDIDVDFKPEDREKVYNYIINRFGKEYTAFVMTNGTCVERGTIDEIGRGLNMPLDEVGNIKTKYENNPTDAKKDHPELFKYFDGLVNTTISRGVHPAAIVISPIPLSEHYGVYHYKDSNGKYIRVLSLNMDELHEINLVKYDILGLKNIGVIKDCCILAGIDYPKAHELNWDDKDVWDDVNKCNIGIFQFESNYAGDCLRRFGVDSVDDMSLVNAALRPSGASYRDSLFAKKTHKNPSKIIDDMLERNYGYLVFQEDTINFLQKICGLSGSDADNVRRAIGRKQIDRLEKALPQILNGYCEKSTVSREVAEKEAQEFLQIIIDSADYQFGFNHSTGYSMLGYMCGYMRHHYPIEFCTALLLNANNEADIADGTTLCKLLGIKVSPIKFRYSKANYFMDKATNTIYKGVGSVKYLSTLVADSLYELRSKKYKRFIDLLYDLRETPIDSKQLDILIKLGYFSEFNDNPMVLLKIVDLFTLFKKGDAKQIKKDKLDNMSLYKIVESNSRGVNKNGEELKNFVINDIYKILCDGEDYIKTLQIHEITFKERVKNEKEFLGYISPSQNEDERRFLLIDDIKPLFRKKDRKRFGLSVFTTSIGSGKSSRFTLFDKDVGDELSRGDIIKCINYKTDGQYFTLLDYKKVD